MSPMNDPSPIGIRDAIGQLAAREPVEVGEKLTLRSIAAMLAADRIGAALVRRADGTIGILSERDLTRALADDPHSVWFAGVMSEALVTADTHEEVLRVAFRMLDQGIRHIAITDTGEVVGVVSSRDVFVCDLG